MLNPDLRLLQYFVCAVESGSYSKAATKLFVSSQAISKGMQQLEAQLGLDILKKGCNGIEPTVFGLMFFERAKHVLTSWDSLECFVNDYHQGVEASFHVGIHSFCFEEHGGTLNSASLVAFLDEHPGIRCDLLEMNGDAIVRGVMEGSLDFGISVPPEEGVEGICLYRFPIAALVASNSEQYRRKNQLCVKDLLQSHLVLLPGEREMNNTLLKEAAAMGIELRVFPIQKRTDNDIDTIIQQNTYAIRPIQHALRTKRTANVSILPIFDDVGRALKDPLHLFWKQGRKLSALEKEFVRYIDFLYKSTHPEEA
jgi:DNA-binding transcriptional LysR family regulator